MYVTLNETEKSKFLNQKETVKYKFVAHSFVPLKEAGKNYCTTCGLVSLRNKLTDWCINKGCLHDVHPQYKQTVKRHTKS